MDNIFGITKKTLMSNSKIIQLISSKSIFITESKIYPFIDFIHYIKSIYFNYLKYFNFYKNTILLF